jgi:hypothetical protein
LDNSPVPQMTAITTNDCSSVSSLSPTPFSSPSTIFRLCLRVFALGSGISERQKNETKISRGGGQELQRWRWE